MRKYIIFLTIILLLAVPKAGIAFNWSEIMWSDTTPWIKDYSGDISFYRGDDRRVGINKQNPQYNLDVSGDISASGTLYSGGGIEITDATPDLTLYNDQTSDADYGRACEIRFDGRQSGGERSRLGVIQVAHDSTEDDQKGIMTLKVHQSGDDTNDPSAAVTIDSSGYVGIGSDTPQWPLNVIHSSSSTVFSNALNHVTGFTNTNSTDNNYSLLAFNDGIGSGYSGALGMRYINHSSNYGQIHFITRGADGYLQRAVITDDGYVGINDVTPAAQLDIDISGAAVVGLDIDGAAAQSANIVDIDDATGDALFTIDSVGNIGIGTTSPDGLLHINGSTELHSIIQTTGDVPVNLDFKSAETSANTILARIDAEWDGNEVARIGFFTGDDTTNKDDGAIKFFTSDAGSSPDVRMVINSDGNVGINDVTPDAQLDIDISGAAVVGLDIDGAAAQSANIVDIDDATGDALFTIGSSGNVGIGTNTPAVPLEVNGIIKRSGSRQAVRTVTATYTLDSTDDIVYANGTFSVKLPTIVADEYPVWRVMNIGSGTITIDATTDASTYINDATSDTLAQYEGVTICNDGTVYWEIP